MTRRNLFAALFGFSTAPLVPKPAAKPRYKAYSFGALQQLEKCFRFRKFNDPKTITAPIYGEITIVRRD